MSKKRGICAPEKSAQTRTNNSSIGGEPNKPFVRIITNEG